MANIAIINAVYPPEPVVLSQMGRDLANYLCEFGKHQVTVLCPYPSRPFGVKYSHHRPLLVTRVCDDNGVNVIRLPSFTAPQSSFVARFRESLSFGWRTCRYLDRHLSEADVVYANSWPLISQALIASYCARRGKPLVLHIQDVYPEALLGKVPRWSRGIIGALFTPLDRWVARQAACVLVISANMRRTYVESRGIQSEKVLTIANWTDENRFACRPDRHVQSIRFGLPAGRFVFLYLGNVGPLAGVELLIKAFHAAQVERGLLIIGGAGSAKANCVELSKKLAFSDIRFIPCTDTRDVPDLQSTADILLLPMRKGGAMSSIPSKLPAYLFSAKPVLATLDPGSDTARFIQEAQCGWVGEADNLEWLAAKMVEVAALPPSILETMGQRGRRYGLEHFSKAAGVSRLANIILNAASGSRDSGSRREY